MDFRLLDFEEKYAAVNLVKEVFLSSGNLGYSQESAQAFLELLASYGTSLDYIGAYDAQLQGVLGFYKEHSHIVYVFVRDENQRQKIGEKLFLEYLRTIKEKGFHTVRVHATLSSIPFFEYLGFDKIGDIEDANGMKYQPMEYHRAYQMLGKTVKVIVDHPYGSQHPYYPEDECTCNYGYVECAEEAFQNAYVVGVYEPVEYFCGKVIAMIFHRNDEEIRLVVSGSEHISHQKVIDEIAFQEKHFDVFLKWLD